MKKILILSTRVPYPLIDGVRIRIYNTAKYLSRHYTVDLLCLSDTDYDPRAQKELEKVFRAVRIIRISRFASGLACAKSLVNGKPLQVNYFYRGHFARVVEACAAEYDLVIANHVRTTEFVKDLPIKKIVDLHDSLALHYGRAMKMEASWKKPAVKFEHDKVKSYEVEMLKTFDHGLVVSDIDRDYLIDNGAPEAKISTLPVAVRDDIVVDEAESEELSVSFLGKMAYHPNVDAVLWFAEEVLPDLLKRHPQLKFYIVGATPAGVVQRLHDGKNIIVTGFLENPFEVIQRSSLMVAPVRLGAGLQNKVLEAMSIGKAVVTTPIGAEGIGGQDGVHYRIADHASDFGNVVSELLQRPKDREVIGDAARSYIADHFTWERIAKRYVAIIQSVLGSSTSERR
ncbi:MAG: hypothetical protein CL946_08625 [Ectothiorhodospiraceae bacterium]|nr:hypothetical protein [Ectothiorhodospiraceae bacterium]